MAVGSRGHFGHGDPFDEMGGGLLPLVISSEPLFFSKEASPLRLLSK